MSYLQHVKKASPKIICVGKNYLKHVKEMGGTNIPQVPLLFLKPWSSINYAPKLLSLPVANQHRVDHQLQLGVYICKPGYKISKQTAMEHVGGYFLGLDLTDRDLQSKAKSQGFPWSLSKGQDNFCPISQPIEKQINPYNIEIQLKVNGNIRQKDFTSSMHFKIDDVISYASNFMSLTEGDLILTGTPQGVGQLKIGDRVEGKATYDQKILAQLNFQIVG